MVKFYIFAPFANKRKHYILRSELVIPVKYYAGVFFREWFPRCLIERTRIYYTQRVRRNSTFNQHGNKTTLVDVNIE